MTNELSATRIAKQQSTDRMQAAAQWRLARAATTGDGRRSDRRRPSVLVSAVVWFFASTRSTAAPRLRSAHDDA